MLKPLAVQGMSGAAGELRLKDLAHEWQEAGNTIFKNILIRGRIAYEVYTSYNGQYEAWCKSVNTSRQGANNYRFVYERYSDLDPSTADKFKARALYEIAGIGDAIARQGAFEWAQEWAGDDYIDFQLAYLSNPAKTPDYIRVAFAARKMSKPQAYELAASINRAPDFLKTVFIKYEVQHAAVTGYILEAYKRRDEPLPDSIEPSYIEIEQGGESGNWAFVWYEGQEEFEVSIGGASESTITSYKAFRRWLRFEAEKEAQAALEQELYITGEIEARAKVEGDKLILGLPAALKEAVQNGVIDIQLSYKVMRFNKTP